jgi:hypothetical protein
MWNEVVDEHELACIVADIRGIHSLEQVETFTLQCQHHFGLNVKSGY